MKLAIITFSLWLGIVITVAMTPAYAPQEEGEAPPSQPHTSDPAQCVKYCHPKGMDIRPKGVPATAEGYECKGDHCAKAAEEKANGGRGANAGTQAADQTWADQERTRRAAILRPDVEAASYIQFDSDAMRRLASAGITNVLAVPPSGLLRGQSALINTMTPPESPVISAVSRYWRGYTVVKSPVAQHVDAPGILPGQRSDLG